MCGICGILDRRGHPVDGEVLDRMTAAMARRGPDGAGRFIDREVGLGHRRLSIIDLDGGAQPIANEDGTIQLVCNGEIYNFVELRAELEALGHRFATASDSEVIVHAYEQWGTACVGRLNGMFAFALFDGRDRSLFLARDHLGIKPLYAALVGGQVVFASAIGALLEHPDIGRELDLGALAELFTFRFVPSPKTLFRQVFKLPPGHWLHVTPGALRIERHWHAVPRHRTGWREADLIEEYRALLADAVRLQMRSDVPVGLFLSSGVDSGALLALMSEQAGGPVDTFTIGFDGGERSSEVADARRMADRFGARHHVMTLDARDYADYLARWMGDLEEPVAHEPAPAFFFLAQLARHQVKVALTGQGADEPWAGYDRYLGIKWSGLYSRLPAGITARVATALDRLPLPLERLKRGAGALAEPDLLTRFAKVYSFFNADLKAELYTGALREGFEAARFGTREAIGPLQRDVAGLDPLSQMLYIDTRANLPDDLLMVADKTSMANSLEVRVPFLDHRLVEFIESLPPQLKLRGMTGKYLHKRALTRWLPRETVYRRKKGFAHPVAAWLRGPLDGLLEDCLLGDSSHLHRYFDRSRLARLVEEHRQGRQPYMRHLWLLLSLELWHREFRIA